MKLAVLTHFFNENLLLPYWINHHKKIFDFGVGINHRSTDGSVEIWKELAPDWPLIDTQMVNFQAGPLDQEVMQIENQIKIKYVPDYILALNTTEFLWTYNIKEKLEELEEDSLALAFGIDSIVMVDEAQKPIQDNLWANRHWGFIDRKYEHRRQRFIHKSNHGNYHLGRHGTNLPTKLDNDLYILWAGYSPYPESRGRKLQIQSQIPTSDKEARLGFEHLIDENSLTENYNKHLAKSYDLMEEKVFKDNYEKWCNPLIKANS